MKNKRDQYEAFKSLFSIFPPNEQKELLKEICSVLYTQYPDLLLNFIYEHLDALDRLHYLQVFISRIFGYEMDGFFGLKGWEKLRDMEKSPLFTAQTSTIEYHDPRDQHIVTPVMRIERKD